MPKIAALITARDAALILPDLLASIEGHVDAVVVGVDDRTVDETREVASAAGCLVADVSLVRDGVMDFGQGRRQTVDFAKSVLPDDIPFFVWLDTDDVLAGPPDGLTPPAANLHTVLDDALRAKPDTESIWLPYIYSRDHAGNIFMEHYRERLIKFSAYVEWQSRLHETCHTKGGPWAIWSEGGGPQRLDRAEARVIVDHRNRKQTEAGKYERNHPILVKMIEEDPNDLRAVREMAEHEYAATHWAESVAWYERFLHQTQNSPGTPLEERWMAILYKAKAERNAGRFTDALRSADRALLMCPQYADAYLELAYGYYVSNHWTKAVFWLEEAEKRDRPSGILQTSPLDYDCIPYQVLHEAYARIGNLEKAMECVERAMQYRPNDEGLVAARTQYAHLHNRQSVVEGAIAQARFLIATNEATKAKGILDALPAGAAEEFPDVTAAKAEVEAATAHLVNLAERRKLLMATELPEREARPWLADRFAQGETVLAAGVDAVALAKRGIKVVAIESDPRAMQRGNREAVVAGFQTLVPSPDNSQMLTAQHLHGPDCLDYPDAPEDSADPLHVCGKERHEHGVWTEGCELCGPVAMLPDMRPDAEVQYHVADPERIPAAVKALGPYDAVVLDDVLNRALDPAKALDEAEAVAQRVLVVVPDGTAPRPTDQTEVRAWSQQEIEQLAWGRGRVVESHFLVGDAGHIGIEYRPGETITDRLPVAIFCGPGLEPWTPDQINTTGLGGSETAVVHLAKELVALGLRVMVYAEAEGIWDGVFYRHHSKFVPTNEIWAFIGWRNPALFDVDVAAKHRYLWLHDIDAGNALTDERAARIEAVLGVSEWHAAHLREKHPNVAEKVAVLRNGIDPRRFTGAEERDPSRFVYVSSPDRGLERALVMWPFIKQAIPEATFSIFYGWENYDRLGRDPGYKNWIMDKAKADGVEWHGRIGQRDLARELMRSGALFYPGPHGFEETFCISALEAQAAGCMPVTRDNGALKETNVHGWTLPNADATITDYIAALKSARDLSDGFRDRMRDWALAQSWNVSARSFLALAAESEKAEQEKVEA